MKKLNVRRQNRVRRTLCPVIVQVSVPVYIQWEQVLAGSPCSSLPFATPSSHDMVSPGSTPQLVSAPRVRGCGRPRKALIPPSYDDKPENVSKEELLKWKKRKNTAEWCYNKLTSEDANVFREREKRRVQKAQEHRWQEIIDAAQGTSSVYTHFEESPRTRAKEKSRAR